MVPRDDTTLGNQEAAAADQLAVGVHAPDGEDVLRTRGPQTREQALDDAATLSRAEQEAADHHLRHNPGRGGIVGERDHRGFRHANRAAVEVRQPRGRDGHGERENRRCDDYGFAHAPSSTSSS